MQIAKQKLLSVLHSMKTGFSVSSFQETLFDSLQTGDEGKYMITAFLEAESDIMCRGIVDIVRRKISSVLQSIKTVFNVHLLGEPPDSIRGGDDGKPIISAQDPDFRNILVKIVQLLINKAESCTFYDQNKLTVLHYASREGWLDIVQSLLKKGADPNVTTIDGFTPLYLAIEKSQKDVVSLLISSGANVNSCSLTKMTPLHCATKLGCLEILQYLLKNKADPNASTIDGVQPLHVAVGNCYKDIVVLLIDYGADVNGYITTELTQLRKAVGVGSLDMGNPLSRANVISYPTTSLTPLHFAIEKGCVEIVQYLLENGANPNSSLISWVPPLHVAIRYSHKDIVALLISYGADVNSCINMEFTPLHTAVDVGCLEIVQYLLEKGADPNTRTIYGSSPLHVAVRNSRKDIVALLIAYRANVNICEIIRKTPLHYAAKTDCLEIVQLLVENGANLKAIDNRGLSPLSFALAFKQLTIIEYLVRASNSQNGHNYTPLNVIIRKLMYIKNPNIILENLNLVRMFIERDAYLTFIDYCKLLRNAKLKEKILQNSNICTQSIRNEFNYKILPELYNIPMTADKLPPMEQMVIKSQGVIQDIEQSVKKEIEADGHCNILKPKILLLRIISAQSYIACFDGVRKKSQLKRCAASNFDVQPQSPKKIQCLRR